jgi:hypothetical protein
MVTPDEMKTDARLALGPQDQREDFLPVTLTFFNAQLPESLSGFLAEVGLVQLRSGMFQTIPGDLWQGVLRSTLRGDPDLHAEETVVYGLSAFGELMGWNAGMAPSTYGPTGTGCLR